MRNVHTPRQSGQIGSEHTPPSERGRQEELEAALYLKQVVGGRAVYLFRSPFTSRSRTTALGVAAALDESTIEPPVVSEIFVPQDIREQVDPSTQPMDVADAELNAVENLKYYLEALRKPLSGTYPVVVLSGLAILRYFTGSEGHSWTLANRIIPTGAVIHEGRDKFKGYVPHGLKAEGLANYLEERRVRKDATRR